MKSCHSWIEMAAIAVALVAATAPAQQQKESQAPSEKEALLKKLATPGEHHQRFDALTTEVQRVRRKRASAHHLREAHASSGHERKKEPA